MKNPLTVPEHHMQGMTVGHVVCGACMHRMQPFPADKVMFCPNPHCEQSYFTFPYVQKETLQKQG